MTAHALLLALLILLCALTELHPRIRTGPLASLLIGALAIAAYLRLTTCNSPAPLPEYLLIGLALTLITTFAIRRHTPRPHNRHPYHPWRITP